MKARIIEKKMSLATDSTWRFSQSLRGFVGIIALVLLTSCLEKMDQSSMSNNPIKPQDVYTKEKPGNWKGMEDYHLPQIAIYDKRKQNIVITVPIENPSPQHYVEKIAIYDNNSKKDLAVKVFSKHARYFEAIFAIHPVPQGDHIKVYAKCNLHDLWMVPLVKNKNSDH